MHELSLCRSLLKLVEPISRQHGAPVSRIVLRIGPLSGADADLLRRAFPQVAAGTCADGAELELHLVSLRVRCLECGAVCDATINRLTCAVCGAAGTLLLSGDELDLLRVDLQLPETEDTHV